MSINQALKNLYEEYFPHFLQEIKNIKTDENLSDDLSSPLLMYVWEDEYSGAHKKILYVGQETNGWYDSFFSLKQNSVNQLIEKYKVFNLSINGSYNSPFWYFIRDLNKRINKTTNHTFIWTNLNKIGKADSAGKPDIRYLDIENDSFNILEKEIKILQPDVIIFATGPNYDHVIEKRLNNVKFVKCCGNSIREFARVEGENLPINTYRIFHPGYIQRRKEKEHYISTLVKLINTN